MPRYADNDSYDGKLLWERLFGLPKRFPQMN
jgi:hypothetical protein